MAVICIRIALGFDDCAVSTESTKTRRGSLAKGYFRRHKETAVVLKGIPKKVNEIAERCH